MKQKNLWHSPHCITLQSPGSLTARTLLRSVVLHCLLGHRTAMASVSTSCNFMLASVSVTPLSGGQMWSKKPWKLRRFLQVKQKFPSHFGQEKKSSWKVSCSDWMKKKEHSSLGQLTRELLRTARLTARAFRSPARSIPALGATLCLNISCRRPKSNCDLHWSDKGQLNPSASPITALSSVMRDFKQAVTQALQKICWPPWHVIIYRKRRKSKASVLFRSLQMSFDILVVA